jgi:deferrochelatase/peroxidase EfeB
MSTIAPPSSQVKPTSTSDIQKLVTRGYNFNFSWHLILTVQDPLNARKFLRQLADDSWLVGADESWVDIEKRRKREQSMPCALSLGITFAGLQKLETDERLLDVLRAKAAAFAQGAWHRAASKLGDVDGSAPDNWEDGFKPDASHLLLVLHANTKEALVKAEAFLKQMAGEKAFEKEWARHEATHLTTDPKKRTVHFGMRDGLSNPEILPEPPEPPGPGEKPDPVHNRHRLGEFVLGYENNAGVISPWRLAAERPESSRVPAAEQSRALADFFKNGSFAAFRKMQQHEAGFRTFVQKQATTLQGKHNLQDAEAFIRAKLLGRWDDGQILQARDTMSSGPTGPAATANFDFTGDQAGHGCPFGSHIRRMNPRDDPVVPIRRRPILRRGMPYGKPYNRENYKKNDEEGYDYKDDEENRGLIGLFFCASLEDQFEHLVGQWANDTPMGPNNRGNARDPLIGQNKTNLHVYDVPLSDTAALALRGLTPFVTTKGTLYAFFPSLSAVKQLTEPPAPVDGTNRPYPCEIGPASP